jgi:hypothetical protein
MKPDFKPEEVSWTKVLLCNTNLRKGLRTFPPTGRAGDARMSNRPGQDIAGAHRDGAALPAVCTNLSEIVPSKARLRTKDTFKPFSIWYKARITTDHIINLRRWQSISSSQTTFLFRFITFEWIKACQCRMLSLTKLVFFARMAELVDAGDLKSLSSNGVWVRAPLRVPLGYC